MPSSIRTFEATFKQFTRLVLDLNIQWQMFRDLYADGKNYEVINATAPTFFSRLQVYLYDGLFLSISRFFDHEAMGGQENLCLKRILGYVEVTAISNALSAQAQTLENLWRTGIKTWRHKKISHNDLSTLLNEQSLPDIPHGDIEALVGGISEFARVIENHVHDRDTSYEVEISKWVPDLFKHLKIGVEKKLANRSSSVIEKD